MTLDLRGGEKSLEPFLHLAKEGVNGFEQSFPGRFGLGDFLAIVRFDRGLLVGGYLFEFRLLGFLEIVSFGLELAQDGTG